MLDKIKWLGHASFRIEADKVIYIDPWELKAAAPEADIVLITHSHYDHFSPPDIEKILKSDTVIIGPADCAGKISAEFKTISPGESVKLDGFKIQAVPAYNKDKNFHPKRNNWVGYLIEINGIKVYHSGDSDVIPEMENLKAVDYILLPIGGTYTMDAREAAALANKIKPKVAIPMHFGAIVGSDNDLELFKQNCKCEVKVL